MRLVARHLTESWHRLDVDQSTLAGQPGGAPVEPSAGALGACAAGSRTPSPDAAVDKGMLL
jgi:hypothetical protein